MTNQQRFRILRKRITTASPFGGAAELPTAGPCVAAGHSNGLADSPHFSCVGATKHGIPTSKRFRPLKREQLREQTND